MKKTFVSDIVEKVGEEVTLFGWVSIRRDHGKLIFFDLRDSSGEVQAVALPNHEEAHAVADTIRPEWVISVVAKVNQRPEKMVNTEQALGHLELEALAIEVLSKAHELPFDKDSELNIDTYLNFLPLTLRTKRAQEIFKLQETLVETFRSTLKNERFTEFQAPAITGGDAEGGANVFKLEYFNDKFAYLTTSPQLYKQIMVGVYERVFTTPKAFRAESHATTRHLNEYSTLDFEMGFIGDHRDVMAMQERVVREYVTAVKEKHADTMKHFSIEVPQIPE